MEQDKKIQEMQFLEQNLQNILFQKQAFQMELSETTNSIKELKNSGDEVFKLAGQLLIKTNKPDVEKSLQEKEKILNTRLKTLETQEDELNKQLESLRKEIIK